MKKRALNSLKRNDFLASAGMLILSGCGAAGASRALAPSLPSAQIVNSSSTAGRSASLDESELYIGSNVAATYFPTNDTGMSGGYVYFCNSSGEWIEILSLSWWTPDDVMQINSPYGPSVMVNSSGETVSSVSSARNGIGTMSESRSTAAASTRKIYKKSDNSSLLMVDGTQKLILERGPNSSTRFSGYNSATGNVSMWTISPNGKLGLILSGFQHQKNPLLLHFGKAAAFITTGSGATTISLSPSTSKSKQISKFALHGPQKAGALAQAAGRAQIMANVSNTSNVSVSSNGSNGQKLQTIGRVKAINPASGFQSVPISAGGGGSGRNYQQCVIETLEAGEAWAWYALENYMTNYTFGVIGEMQGAELIDASAIAGIIGAQVVVTMLIVGALAATGVAVVDAINAYNECTGKSS